VITVRLTLRTLLAYLDDTLEPAQAKIIGQKIAESAPAQELIGRIREVVRRRRLTTPPETGPGARPDANTIAEYIDSVLPPEQLSEVEEICLESDVHLAEMAACHQILTIILSRPYIVPTPARQRMYGLIQGREAIPYRKAKRTSSSEGGEVDAASENSEADETLLLGLPSYHRRWVGIWIPVAVVLLLGAVLSVAIWQVLPGVSSPGERIAANKPAIPSKPVDEKVAAKAAGAVSAPREPSRKETALPNESKAEGAKAPPLEVKGQPPASPAGEGNAAAGTGGPAVKDSSGAAPTVTPPLPAAESMGPSNNHRPVGTYAVGDIPTILLHQANPNEPWQRLVRGNAIATGERLVSLPGYRSELRLESGVQLLLWGDLPDSGLPFVILESEVMLHDNPAVDLDLTLLRGRIALANHKAQGPARIRLRFHKEVWELTLLENGAEVALELVGLPEVGFSKEAGKNSSPVAILGVYVLQGPANLKVGSVTHLLREPVGPGYFNWNSINGAAPGPQTMDNLPPWGRKLPARGKDAQAMRQAQDKLASHMWSKATVEIVLQEALKEKDAPTRILAVYCFGATDDLSNLMDALVDEAHPELRVPVITTLRHWIGLGADHDMKLYSTLEGTYGARPAEIIMDLLHPYSDRQKQEPETYETLIAYLKNEKLAIRVLAHSHLLALVPEGKRISYDPAGRPDERELAYVEWKKLIPSGKLPPRGTLPPANGGR
jgi:hypothetical protein